jgi:thiol-disulfide isomerase/thioredoxin
MPFLLISSLVLLWIVVLLNLLLTLGIIRKINAQPAVPDDSSAPHGLPAGTTAPDFTAQTLDGSPVSLAMYAGKSVAFQFLSVHCKPCREILPELLELAPLAARAGVEFVFVMLDEASQVRPFVEEFQLSLPVLVAPRTDNDFAEKYQIKGTPNYCLIDGQGQVISAGHPGSGAGYQLAANWRKQKARATALVTAERR